MARADGKVVPLLAERRVTSDSQGRFPFFVPTECEGRDVAIERSTWHSDFVVDRSFGDWMLPQALQNDPEKARSQMGVIGLERGKVITGRIQDAEGQPARGVAVYVAWQYPEYLGMPPLTRTGNDGRYRLRVPPTRDQYRIFVLPTDAVPRSLKITKNFGEQPVVKLARGTRIRGRVTDAAGKGVADVVVQGNGDDSVYHGIDEPLVCVRTDDEGRYELPPLALPNDVRVLSNGWTGAWQRRGETLVDVYLPTIATAAGALEKRAEGTPPESLEINFAPVESVKLTARCFESDGKPASLNMELYGAPPGQTSKAGVQLWRGRFSDVADEPGRYELNVPKGLRDAALDLMFNNRVRFQDATRAARPSDQEANGRTEVRYPVIDADDDTIEIRLPPRTDKS
jgi:hypothetical protein